MWVYGGALECIREASGGLMGLGGVDWGGLILSEMNQTELLI